MTVHTVTPKRRFRGKPRGRELDPRLLEGLRELLGDERQDATLGMRTVPLSAATTK